MHHLPIAVLSVLALGTASLPAQFSAGWRNVGLANVTSSGSRNLASRIYYPSNQAGQNTPLRSQAGGYPVLVFLHGLGGRAVNYTHFGEAMAEAGFIAVLNDTAQFNLDGQLRDAIALFPTLVAENLAAGSFLRGALDMTRAGIAGHSMGGGNTVRTLAANPGYRAGFCYAPWDGLGQWTNLAPNVRVPLEILHGEGDPTVNWRTIGLEFYNKATNYTGLKSFVLLDTTADHQNVVRLSSGSSADDRAVFARAMAMTEGWFDHHLRDGVTGLENAVGAPVRGDVNFKSIFTAYRAPELWRFGPVKIGTTSSMSLGGEPGSGAIYLSSGTANIPLPFGVLRLDPQVILPLAGGTLGPTRLLTVPTTIPNSPALVGSRVYFQALTDGGAPGLQLSGLVPIVIE